MSINAVLTLLGGSFVKKRPKPAKLLKPKELVPCLYNPKNPKTFTISDIWADVGGHYRIKFNPAIKVDYPDGTFEMWQYGYIFGQHWLGITAALQQKTDSVAAHSPAHKSYTLHDTMLLQQNNNRDWRDWGSLSNLRSGPFHCGFTSAAMVLGTVWPNAKVKQHAYDAGGQFEDWVGGIFKKLGLRSTYMEDIVQFFQYLGFRATASRTATVAEGREVLDDLPFIMGRAFRDSGHFVAVVGYCDVPDTTIDIPVPVGSISNMVASNRKIITPSWIINDPNGEPILSGSYNHYKEISTQMTSTAGLHVPHSNAVLEDIYVDGGPASGWCVCLDPSTKNHGNAPERPIEIIPKPEKVQQQQPESIPHKDEIPVGCARITVKISTFLKADTRMSNLLKADEKIAVPKGYQCVGVVSTAPGGHYSITLPDKKLIAGRDVWYLYGDDITIETPGGYAQAAPGTALTENDIKRVAHQLKCEVAALKAVIEVECAGSGMLPSNKPKILFEALYFSDFTDGQYDRSHRTISSSYWNRDLYVGGEGEWDRFNLAASINRMYAIGSASWGLGQVMGAHAFESNLGFKGTDAQKAEQFYKMNLAGEGAQLEIMGRFLLADYRLVSAIRRKQWAKFAAAYNGESYYVNRYDIKLRQAYTSHR